MLHNKHVFAIVVTMLITSTIMTSCGGVSPKTLATKTTTVSSFTTIHTPIPALTHPPTTATPTSTPTILFIGKITYLRSGELYIIGADGSNQRLLASGISEYLWSPDGKKIAYITPLVSANGDVPQIKDHRLWAMNQDGTHPVELSQPSQGRYWTDSVDWSPDSQQLVYSAGPSIYRINVDGRGFTRLVYDSSDGADSWSYSLVHWLRDGRISVVTQNQGVRQIYIMNSDGFDKQEVDLSFFLRESQRVEITKSKITIIDSVGREVFHLNVDLGIVQWRISSPDGTKIAFAADGDGDFEIYVFDIINFKLTQLTHNTAWDDKPAWSPDGERIAFTSNQTGNYEIYIMNSDGTRQTQLTFASGPEGSNSPAWQP